MAKLFSSTDVKVDKYIFFFCKTSDSFSGVWAFSFFPDKKPSKPSHGMCRPMFLIWVLVEGTPGHSLHLQAGFLFPCHGITRKRHRPRNPLPKAVSDICDRAAFLSADNRKSLSEGRMGWEMVTKLSCTPYLGWKSPRHPSCSLARGTAAAVCHWGKKQTSKQR